MCFCQLIQKKKKNSHRIVRAPKVLSGQPKLGPLDEVQASTWKHARGQARKWNQWSYVSLFY